MEEKGFRVTALGHTPGFIAVRSDAELRIAGPATVVFELLDSGRGFLALTTFRPAASVQENVAAFQTVPTRLRARIGKRSPGYWLIAHWQDVAEPCQAKESGCERAVTSSAEYLWLIPQPEGVADSDWAAAAGWLASETGQAAFVIRRAQDRQTEIRGTDGRVWARLGASAEIMAALAALARERATKGTLDGAGIRDLLQDRLAANAAMAPARVALSVATADSIGTHWLFRHIDACPGPRI